MDEFDEIASFIKDKYSKEIVFGPRQQINDLILFPIYEVLIYGINIKEDVGGGSVQLQPHAIVVINKDGEVSSYSLKNSKNHKKSEDNLR